MNNNIHFQIAFNKTMQIEGLDKLTNNPKDPGGMTYSGISRRYFPEWEGWLLIDEWLYAGKPEAHRPNLSQKVKDFYRINFWNRIYGDALAELSPNIAFEVFDTAVNLDVTRAVIFLQTAHNIARGTYGSDIVVDGKLGPKTIDALKMFLCSMPGSLKTNEEILLNCCNGEQYIYYRNNPNRQYFRGWFRRV